MTFESLLSAAVVLQQNIDSHGESLTKSAREIYESLNSKLKLEEDSFTDSHGQNVQKLNISIFDHEASNYVRYKEQSTFNINSGVFDFAIMFNFPVNAGGDDYMTISADIQVRYDDNERQFRLMDRSTGHTSDWEKDFNLFCNSILKWIRIQLTFNPYYGYHKRPTMKWLTLDI